MAPASSRSSGGSRCRWWCRRWRRSPIILFLFSWNSFLWPLLVLSKPEVQTAPVALGALVGLNRVFWNAIMVAAVLMTVPMLILFLFLQRYFIAGITAGAVK